MRIELRMLGTFEVKVDDCVLEASAWGRRHPRQLLQMLALSRGHELTRDEAMRRLWPDAPSNAAANRLHHTTHRLRQAFAHAGMPREVPVLLLEHGWLRLNPAHEFVVDALRFGSLIERARAAPVHESAPGLLAQALELYGGDLLASASRYEEWLDGPREELRRAYSWALGTLAAVWCADEPQRAIALYQRLVEVEPSNESVHRALMQLHAAAGDTARVLMQYSACKRHLERDLDASPSAETEALLERIVAASRERLAEAPPPKPPTARFVAPPHSIALFGREADMDTLAAWFEIDAARMVTITGGAGMGKTRLAFALAQRIQGRFADGVAVVALTRLNDASDLADAIAQALDLSTQGGPVAQRLRSHLRARRMLLVLDRFEHLIDGVPLVDDLLAAAPALCILATSQAPLHVRAERLYELPSLVARGPGPAVQLFCAAARSANGAVDSSEGVAVVERICRRLSGNALAIELAAAQTNVLALPQILRALDHPLELLTNPARDADAQQSSLRAAIDWSCSLLEPGVRRVYALLGAFAGQFDLKDVGAVLSEFCPLADLCAALSTLVERHLVVRAALVTTVEETTDAQFELLDPIRAHACELMMRTPECEQVKRAHALHFADRAEAWLGEWRAGQYEAALAGFGSRAPDAERALDWHAIKGDTNAYLRIAHAVATLILFSGAGAERALAGLRRALGSRTVRTMEERRLAAWCHFAIARILSEGEPLSGAHAEFQAARRLARGCDDPALVAHIHASMAWERINQTWFRAARLHADSVERGPGAKCGPLIAALAWMMRAHLHVIEGNRNAAERACDEVLAIGVRINSAWVVFCAMRTAAELALASGHPRLARTLCERSSMLVTGSGPTQSGFRFQQCVLEAAIAFESDDMVAAQNALAGLRCAEFQTLPRNFRFAGDAWLDFIAVETGVAPAGGVARSLPTAEECAFDATFPDVYPMLGCYRIRLFARDDRPDALAETLDRTVRLLRKTRNPLWYSWLCDACCHALIEFGELRACKALLGCSRTLIADSGIAPTPRQARGWRELEAVTHTAGELSTGADLAPMAWHGAQPESLRVLQQLVHQRSSCQADQSRRARVAVI